MPPKRKAPDDGNGSPTKRVALTSANTRSKGTPTHQLTPAATPKVRRTYGRRPASPTNQGQDAENPNATPEYNVQTEPGTKLAPEIHLPASSPAKTRGRRKHTDTEESPTKRRPKKIKADQKHDPTPAETPRRAKPTTKVVVEIPPFPRPVATPPLPPPQSSPSRVSRGSRATASKPGAADCLSSSLAKAQSSLLSSKQLPPPFHPYLHIQRRAILQNLNNYANFVDNEQKINTDKPVKDQLQDLLNGTVTRSEGNSCLFLGPRGSGKSKILDECLRSLPQPPIIIRLSGWIHQTDRLAMREIAYQLGQQTGKTFLQQTDEIEVDDFIEQDNNPFVDRPEPEVAEVGLTVPPSSHLPALISVIPTLSRPTIVILDAFDLFALHPRQALLYCLLDTVQGCRVGMDHKGLAVVGITTRIDTINLLEKRVKSRFSGRIIHASGLHTPQRWLSLAKKALCPEMPRVNTDTSEADVWNGAWNKRISTFLDEKEVVETIKDTAGLTKDPRLLFRILMYMISRLSPSSPFPSSLSLVQAVSSQRSRLPLYDSLDLPYPALCLLIASFHSITSGHEVFTFEMLFSIFRNQLRASIAAPVQVNGGSIGMLRCSRVVLLSAFEHLIDCRVFAPAAPLGVMAKEFARYRTTLEREEVRKVVEKTGQVALKKWLNKAE